MQVGLGTDVSGGFSPSILTAVQHASMCSKVVAMAASASAAAASAFSSPASSSAPNPNARFADRQLPVPTLLHLATLGGAQVCELAGRIGSLEAGKAFDALVVSLATDANPGAWSVALDDALDVQRGGEGPEAERRELESMLERFLFTGDDRNIRRVYVDGRWVGGVEFAR